MKALALLAIAFACCAARAQAQVEIAWRPQVQPASDLLTLGDVAVLHSTDLRVLRTLVDLPVGRAPLPGEHTVLQQASVAAWIRARAGLEPTSLRWSGPESVDIAGGGRLVSGDEIAATAEASLREWLLAQAAGAQVELQGTPRDVLVPPGPLRLSARPLQGATLRSRMLVWVEVRVADRFVRLAAVPFRVAAWREGLAVARPLTAGASISQDDVAVRPIDVAAEPAGVVVGTPAAGLRTRRNLSPGAALRTGDLEPAPAVQRGQWASLRSGEGAVLAEARVEVLQDGRVGQSVRVRPSGGAGALFARVTGPGQLELAR